MDLEFWADDLEDKYLSNYSITDAISHLMANDLSFNEIDEVFKLWRARDEQII